MTYITSSCNIFEREWIFKLPSNPLLLISFPWLVVSPFVSLIHMMKERLGFELMLVWITGFGCLLLICFDIEFSRGSFLFFIHWHNPNTWAMLMDMGLSWAYLSTHTCWFDNGLTFWALFRLVPAARLINHKGQAQGFWALFHGSCVALKTQLGPNLRFICMGNEPIWMGPRLEIWFF